MARVRHSLRPVIQEQFHANRRLDHGNPSSDNIRLDFGRFGSVLDWGVDPANAPRLAALASLNRWRNVAAHDGVPPALPLTLATIRSWLLACEGLAVSLDGIMYNQLRRLLRRRPW